MECLIEAVPNFHQNTFSEEEGTTSPNHLFYYEMALIVRKKSLPNIQYSLNLLLFHVLSRIRAGLFYELYFHMLGVCYSTAKPFTFLFFWLTNITVTLVQIQRERVCRVWKKCKRTLRDWTKEQNLGAQKSFIMLQNKRPHH